MEDSREIEQLLKNVAQQKFIDPKILKEKLDSWKEQKLNIGFIGDRGCGKSTLINTLRGLFPSDEGAANTGQKETTKCPTPYPYPDNPNIILYDLPGKKIFKINFTYQN